MFAAALNVHSAEAEPKTWIVDDDGSADFHTIQEAINAANGGDTIRVREGIYSEQVIVNKTLVLFGENRSTTIIAGSGTGAVFSMTADYVNVSGFTIQGGGWQSAAVVEANQCSFSENIVENNQGSNFAISLTCFDSIIDNNIIRGNPYADGIRAGGERNEIRRNIIENNGLNGIYSGCYNSTIQDNIIARNGWDGIRQEGSNSIILENRITNNGNNGISLGGANNTIINNTIMQNGDKGYAIDEDRHNIPVGSGISVGYVTGVGTDNDIQSNIIKENAYDGILLYRSSNNLIRGNLVHRNRYGVLSYGIQIEKSFGNIIYHNNFDDDNFEIGNYYVSENVWDDGCPSGGNYWSDYNATDLFSGPYQNMTGSDGIRDTPYIIDAKNTDRYPLMGMFSEFDWVSIAAPEQRIQTICNSTISNLIYNGTAISFDVTGNKGTSGFCRIQIPKVFMNSTFAVFVNGTEIAYTLLPFSNENYTYLYFTYTHSTEQVIIVPEFPSFLILPLFFIATLLAATIYRRKARAI
jgi:parallel beta-helix repeat protein